MQEINVITLDLAKRIFHRYRVNRQGQPVLSRKLRRNQLHSDFRQLPACLIRSSMTPVRASASADSRRQGDRPAKPPSIFARRLVFLMVANRHELRHYSRFLSLQPEARQAELAT